MTPVLDNPYISVSINPENIIFLYITNGGHTRKAIMATPMFLRIQRSILSINKIEGCLVDHEMRSNYTLCVSLRMPASSNSGCHYTHAIFHIRQIVETDIKH